MTSSTGDSEPSAARDSAVRRLRPGIKLLFSSLLIAVSALGLFVYALGTTQPTEQPAQVRQIPLALAMIGFGASSLLFWIGFLQLAKVKR